MTTIGSIAAKTQLSELLKRVAKGEKITITTRGKPVAMLVPVESSEEEIQDVESREEQERRIQRTVDEMLARRDREGPRLGPDLTIKQLIEEGRR